jgi:hypothetical protein
MSFYKETSSNVEEMSQMDLSGFQLLSRAAVYFPTVCKKMMPAYERD